MKTYWQKIKGIVGPAYSKDFDKTGQQNTRSAIEKYITSVSDKHTDYLMPDAHWNRRLSPFAK